MDAPWDVVIVGAGAAGLATAIFTRERNPNRSVLLLDGARKPGAKILVSGGTRCNVTNTVVTERDFRGGPPAIVRRILRRFSARDTVDFFARAGVALHEEEDGKLFPDSNRSRDVLDALLKVASDTGVLLRSSQRVVSVSRTDDRFMLQATTGDIAAARVVLATGGLSLPKTGSDGVGHAIARGLGHSIVPTTPALAPLVLEPGELHAALSGVSLDVELTLWVDGSTALRLRNPMLWTHFGISGPAALDMSRHWLRARLEQRTVALTASFVPGLDFSAIEQHWIEARRMRPRSSLGTSLGSLIPESMAAAVLERLQIDPATQLANLERDNRRRLTRALTEWPLTISDSRGYNYAEVTAGGVDLREIDASTMQSRICPGLFLVGEILDVDGRLGGFNFQWAWSTAYVAAAAIAAS